PQTQERVLHQLLRVVAIPGHEVKSLEQALVLFHEERVEAGPCFDTSGGKRHDLALASHPLALCSHDAWMHRGRRTLTDAAMTRVRSATHARHPSAVDCRSPRGRAK